MGYYANMLGNEMFLDSTSLRNSAVSHAKHLNVIPSSVRASKAYLNITFIPTGSPSSLTITKNTKFNTSIDGINYKFVTNKTTTVLRSTLGTYTTSNLEIIEGKILNKAYTVNGADTTQRFILPNVNIDTSTVSVTVQKSGSDSSVETYTDGNAVDVTTIKSTDKVFFLQEIEDAKYEITFGDGAVGKQLSDGNIIFIEYIVTAGSAADKANTFVASGSVGNLNSENYTLTTANASIGGANLQTIESLKYLAPKLYQAQGRACTKEDYKAIVLRDKPDIESIVVYGGEDADPIQYGKVFIAVKPSGNNVFSIATKEAIKTNILKKSNVVTVTPEIVDPIYFYLLIDTTVNYDPVTNLTDEVTLKTNIDASIQNYLQTNLERFDQKFRYSKLVQDIDNTSSAIRNSRSTIKYRQLITPAIMNTPVTYTQNFNNALEKGSLKSTSFVATDGNTYSMVDDSAGVIKLARTTSGVLDSPAVYFTQTDGSTTQGSIDYTTGQIILTSLRPAAITDGTLSIKLTVTPEQNNSDITPKWEQLLTYDVTDTEAITISMVAETII
jgi:hypothetical protein